MEPNLKENEVLLLSKISYKLQEIERFDVVVINTKDDLIIKRVIGLPGDSVQYKDNKLYINDEIIKDPYQKNETEDFHLKDICEIGNDSCTMKIPENKYLVLGDNREISADSRTKGLFDITEIEGKVVFRLWPLNKMKIIQK